MTRATAILGAAVVTTTLALAGPLPVQAATSPALMSVDPAGDVHVSAGGQLTRGQKLSIDLRRVTVEREDNSARIVVKIRQVMRVKKFDQMFFIDWSQRADTPGGAWGGQVGFTSKGVRGYADYADPNFETVRHCAVRVAVRPRLGEVIARVPLRCVPEGEMRMGVAADTGHFRTDAVTFSSDSAPVRGYHVVR
jgi:hypothetical protein